MKPSVISTQRLKLRRSRKGDEKVLFYNYCSDIISSQYLTRQPHIHIDQTSKFLKEWCNLAWDNGSSHFSWVIALENTDEPIGLFLIIKEDHKAQIHYGIGRAFERNGFMHEAGHAVIKWLEGQPNLQRIWTVCDLEHYRSIKVLEKLGFENEGTLRNGIVLPAFGDLARDCYIFSRTYNQPNA